jgi:hypothetical protein
MRARRLIGVNRAEQCNVPTDPSEGLDLIQRKPGDASPL